ncbi:MAG: hypothetical protein ABFD16_24765 [Thermoguttaceae bacterium]
MTRKVTFLGIAAMAAIAVASSAAAQSLYGTQQPNSQTASKGMAALQQAADTNRYLFVFFYSDGKDANTRAMSEVFDAAMTRMADRADGITLHVMDPAEKPIVDKFSARGAPMPLVLAIAPTGAATRAFPKKFEEVQLQQGFVSPCAAMCMKAIQDRHLLLICVQNHNTQFNDEALQGVQTFKADPQYDKVTDVVLLNPDNQAEQSFLKALQVNPRTTKAITLLVTPPGAPVGSFEGPVTKEEIVAKLAAAQSSGCPGGKCGPGGCGPKK